MKEMKITEKFDVSERMGMSFHSSKLLARSKTRILRNLGYLRFFLSDFSISLIHKY